MREILFRGKRVDNGEWIEGYFLEKYSTFLEKIMPFIKIVTKSKNVLAAIIVKRETIGQYTGLTDKNGKRIFEGDVVSGFFNHEKIVGYIFYGSDASFFIQRDGLFGIGLNNASDWLEVIGNIHDSPELLKETNHE